MMRRLAVSMLFLAATAVSAQQAPPLVRDTTPRTGDSALVRAAKRTLAARRGLTLPQFRVTDASLKRSGGRVAFGTGPVNGPTVPSPPEPPGPPVPQAPPDRSAEIAKRVRDLEQEQQRMRTEADEGPYGEVDEDVVERRLSQIPNEIQDAQRPVPPPNE